MSFCPLPFVHAYVRADGSLASCCEAQDRPLTGPAEDFMTTFNSPAYKALRAQFLKGERPENCHRCWRAEADGLDSDRLQALRYYADVNEERWREDIAAPLALELKFDNQCNLKCRMCEPASSRRLLEDAEIFGRFRYRVGEEFAGLSADATIDALLAMPDERLRDLRLLLFSGGEPLLAKRHVPLLRRLIEAGATDLELRYSTNLLAYMPRARELDELWKPFRRVQVKGSIDGLGAVYEYIRTGGKFSRLMEAFEALLATQVHVRLECVVQAYNIFQLPEIYREFRRYLPDDQIDLTLLNEPEFLRMGVYPMEKRTPLIEALRAGDSRLHDVADRLERGAFVAKEWEAFQAYTRAMDEKIIGRAYFGVDIGAGLL